MFTSDLKGKKPGTIKGLSCLLLNETPLPAQWRIVQNLDFGSSSMWGCGCSPCFCVGSFTLSCLRHGVRDEGPMTLSPLHMPVPGVKFLFVKGLLCLIHPGPTHPPSEEGFGAGKTDKVWRQNDIHPLSALSASSVKLSWYQVLDFCLGAFSRDLCWTKSCS